MVSPKKVINLYFPYPDECRVTQKAIEVNGLTKSFLDEHCNSTIEYGIRQFVGDINAVDTIIAHNGTFDLKFINNAIKKYNINGGQIIKAEKLYDTMKTTVDFCAIPRRGGGYKYPKLSELADKLKINYTDLTLHDAMSDVILTARCFKKMMSL